MVAHTCCFTWWPFAPYRANAFASRSQIVRLSPLCRELLKKLYCTRRCGIPESFHGMLAERMSLDRASTDPLTIHQMRSIWVSERVCGGSHWRPCPFNAHQTAVIALWIVLSFVRCSAAQYQAPGMGAHGSRPNYHLSQNQLTADCHFQHSLRGPSQFREYIAGPLYHNCLVKSHLYSWLADQTEKLF